MPAFDITPWLPLGVPGILLAALWYLLPDLKEHLKASAAALRATADTLRALEPRLANIELDTSATREDLAVVRAHLAMDRKDALDEFRQQLKSDRAQSDRQREAGR